MIYVYSRGQFIRPATNVLDSGALCNLTDFNCLWLLCHTDSRNSTGNTSPQSIDEQLCVTSMLCTITKPFYRSNEMISKEFTILNVSE